MSTPGWLCNASNNSILIDVIIIEMEFVRTYANETSIMIRLGVAMSMERHLRPPPVLESIKKMATRIKMERIIELIYWTSATGRWA